MCGCAGTRAQLRLLLRGPGAWGTTELSGVPCPSFPPQPRTVSAFEPCWLMQVIQHSFSTMALLTTGPDVLCCEGHPVPCRGVSRPPVPGLHLLSPLVENHCSKAIPLSLRAVCQTKRLFCSYPTPPQLLQESPLCYVGSHYMPSSTQPRFMTAGTPNCPQQPARGLIRPSGTLY